MKRKAFLLLLCAIVLACIAGVIGCAPAQTPPPTPEYQIVYRVNDSNMGSLVCKKADGTTVNSGVKVLKGTDLIFTATATDGYKFDGYFKGEQKVYEQTQYTLNVQEAVDLTAKFCLNSFTLNFSVNNSEMGSVAESFGKVSGQKVEFNTPITIVATEKTGYDFKEFLVNGDSVDSGSSYSFMMPAYDCTVVAEFEAEKRYVYFNDGYNRVHTEEVDYNTPVSEPEYVKDNYNFLGWCTDATLEEMYDFDSKVTVDFTLYAKTERTIILHDVMFVDTDGAQVDAIQQVEDGYTLPNIPTIEKTGYEFTGWEYFNQQKQEYEKFNSSIVITSDLIVRATFKIKTFTVNFYLDNEMNILHSSVEIDYNGKVAKPSTPQDENKIFIKWVYSDDLEAEFNFETQISENLNLIVVWEPKPLNTFTVEFYDDDEEHGKIWDTQSVKEGESAFAPANPQKEGHKFIGWDKKFDKINDDIKVYAVFEIQTFKVVFVDHDGKELKKEQIVNYGTAAIAPEDPIREGYEFTGWDKAFASVKEDLTIKATYSVNTYVVKFYDGDQVMDGEDCVQQVEYASVAAVPITPEKPGYSFVGWYSDSTCTTEFTFSTPITKDTNVYAGFTEIITTEYSVKFVLPDGKVLSTQTVLEGNSAIAPADPSVEGKIFNGWDKAFDDVRQNLTVTAKFNSVELTVNFYAQDGTTLIESVKVEYGNTAKDKEPTDVPDVANKDFVGWDKDVDTYVIKEDTDFIAQYAFESRKVVFMIEGVKHSEQTVEYGSFVNIPNTPTRAGKIFRYWKVQGQTTAFKFETPITEDTVIEAHFEDIEGICVVTFYDPFGKECRNVQLVRENGYATEPAPYRDGSSTQYKWCLADGTEFKFEETPITADLSLHAKPTTK